MATFLEGLTDVTTSLTTSAATVINALNGSKAASTTPGATADLQLDAYGRKPGDTGYGTTTPPAGVSTASGLAGWPAWSKGLLIAAGVTLILGIARRLLTRKRK
jgi:hypothetical protein